MGHHIVGDKYVNGEIFPRPPPVHYGRRNNGDMRPREQNYGPPSQHNYDVPPRQQNYGRPLRENSRPSPQQSYMPNPCGGYGNSSPPCPNNGPAGSGERIGYSTSKHDERHAAQGNINRAELGNNYAQQRGRHQSHAQPGQTPRPNNGPAGSALIKSQKLESSPILGIQVVGNERGYGTMGGGGRDGDGDGGSDDEPEFDILNLGRTESYVTLSDYKWDTGVFTVMRICIGQVDEARRMVVSDTSCSIFRRKKKDSVLAGYGYYAHLPGQVAPNGDETTAHSPGQVAPKGDEAAHSPRQAARKGDDGYAYPHPLEQVAAKRFFSPPPPSLPPPPPPPRDAKGLYSSPPQLDPCASLPFRNFGYHSRNTRLRTSYRGHN